MALTEEQQATFPVFRQTLIDEGLLHEMYDNKPSMYRFLQARQWDVTKAALMYRNHTEWRAEMGLDECVPTAQGPIPKFLLSFKLPELVHIKTEGYPFTHHKIGKDGRPVYFDRLGAIDFGKMVQKASPE